MRKRTPSEIKAYGDGYAEAYKEFCHLLKNHDVDKAMRKMEIFVKAVEITVETAMDEPQLQLTARCLNCNNAKACKEKHWEGCVYEPKDEKTCETCRHWKYIAHEWQCEACKCQGYEPKDEPQMDLIACPIVEDDAWIYEEYQRGIAYAWEVAQKVFDSTLTFYEAEDVAKQIHKTEQTDCDYKCVQTEVGCESTDCAWKQ